MDPGGLNERLWRSMNAPRSSPHAARAAGVAVVGDVARAAAHAERLAKPRIVPNNAASYSPPNLNAFRGEKRKPEDCAPAIWSPCVRACFGSAGVRWTWFRKCAWARPENWRR